MTDKKVLIVEDDEDVMFVLCEGLSDSGYEIIGAFDGDEALEKIRKERPDLIILDIMMPELNGFELKKKLKIDVHLKDIPVLIITGRQNMKGLFSDTGENKVLGFIEKPFTLEVLKEEVEKIM